MEERALTGPRNPTRLRAIREPTMMTDGDKRQNRRTALILLSVVIVFFIGVIVRHWLYGG